MSDDQQLTRVRGTVERFVRARPGLPGDVDREDVVQETMARLLENRSRLEPEAWEAYAVVSARNLLLDRERAGRVRRRHQHRLHTPDVTAGVEEQVLTQEEHSALRRAMTALPPEDRSLLHERYGTGDASARSIAPAAAARLARARGKLRVAYLLEHTGLALPTDRCRPVLEALSSADRRRQERLGAGRHLMACRVCATYAPALTRRERALAALHPLAWLGIGAGGLWAAARRHPARTTTAVAATAALAFAGTSALSSPDTPLPSLTADGAGPQATPAPTGPSTAAPSIGSGTLAIRPDGPPLLPRNGSALPEGPVEAERVVVQAVAADEGFWVGSAPQQRVWVQMVGAGESPSAVRVGDRVSFDGRTVRLVPGRVADLGVSRAEGADELAAMGTYVEAPRSSLVVHR